MTTRKKTTKSKKPPHTRLSVAERLALLGLLPQQGNLVTMRIVRELREALMFSETEIKRLELRQEGTTWRWANERQPKAIMITDAGRDVIRNELRVHDENNTLTDSMLTLWDRFMT